MMTDAPRLRATEVILTDDHLVVDLEDGRSIVVPLWWYPKLAMASRQDRERWRFTSNRRAITWDNLDEDISVRGLLSENARPAPMPNAILENTLEMTDTVDVHNSLPHPPPFGIVGS